MNIDHHQPTDSVMSLDPLVETTSLPWDHLDPTQSILSQVNDHTPSHTSVKQGQPPIQQIEGGSLSDINTDIDILAEVSTLHGLEGHQTSPLDSSANVPLGKDITHSNEQQEESETLLQTFTKYASCSDDTGGQNSNSLQSLLANIANDLPFTKEELSTDNFRLEGLLEILKGLPGITAIELGRTLINETTLPMTQQSDSLSSLDLVEMVVEKETVPEKPEYPASAKGDICDVGSAEVQRLMEAMMSSNPVISKPKHKERSVEKNTREKAR